MRWVFRWIVRGSGETRPLDVYDVAFLAGGARHVVDSAVTTLNQRGLLVVHNAQVHCVEGKQPLHPVERAMAAFCRHPTDIDTVRAVLQRSPEVQEIGRELAVWGLVAGAERQMTPAGRRHLQQAQLDARMLEYVFPHRSPRWEGAVPPPAARPRKRPGGNRRHGDLGPGLDTDPHSGSGHSSGGGAE
ncbi:TIGR04222 domain-containing membrane protein [Streptomyces sp. YC504]|uniref:TIGR04222 domain-containing membrane protein n=1 Tax=Streptomyces mesophilus TaxID=1775132 RepID=A0A6G4XJL6_9ACTN|nr:TIGR04222 domain-containing membrane protein [Streptomyces mesophilus]NGO77766.1 TIGR04222 domain-containing membrane protein [Streptomyces mesophilus]